VASIIDQRKVAKVKGRPVKNPDKPWTVRYQYQGRQRERSFTTQREAKDFVAEFEHQNRLNLFVDPRNGSTPFTEYAGRWLDALDRSPNTREAYHSVLANYIAPAVDGRTLAQVSQDRDGVQAIITGMRDKGLSATYQGRALTVITGAVEAAVAAGRLPSHRLGGLKVRRTVSQQATIIPATTEQLEALAGVLGHVGLTVWIMAGTGLRIGECLAVRMDGFLDGGKRLRVHEQTYRNLSMGPLKGRRPGEYRDVPVPAWLWAKVQAYGADGYLFGGLTYNSYRHKFRTAAVKAGLPDDFTVHQLRHMYASKLLTNGVPITDVSKWLGHRDINVTHQIYSHLVPESWDRAREVLELV
jgi:integrase